MSFHHIFAGTQFPEAKGSGLEFCRQYLVSESDYNIQWASAPFLCVLQELEKKLDMALFLARTPQREKVIKFSKTSLFSTSIGIVVTKGSELRKAQSLFEFQGKTLGHSMNSVIPEILGKDGI